MKKLWDVCNEDFESVLNRYERHLRNQRFSSNTVERYKKDISRLLVFSSDRHPTLEQADAYRDSLIEDGVAASSVNTVGCALKQFYGMYGEQFKIKTLRVRNIIPYFFSEDEVERIFDAANQWRSAILFIPAILSQIALPLLAGYANNQNQFNKILKN